MAGAVAALAAAVLAVSPVLPTPPAVTPPHTATSGGRHALPGPAIEPTYGVAVELSTCFWDPPPSGFLPVRVEIRNDAPRAREYRATFNASGGYYRYGTTFQSSHTLPVPAESVRRFDLLVPMRAGPSSGGLPNSMQLGFDGPGSPLEPVSLFMNNYYLHSGSGHRGHTPWVGVSESLATAHWETAKTLLGTRDSTLLVGSRFDPACLPADWRAYAGFSGLALTRDEWHDLAPAARVGIERWIARGGRLWLAGGEALPSRLGFGEIRGLAPKEEWTAATLADAVLALRDTPAGTYHSWSLATELGAPAFPKGLMLTFITGFALLVGPVNLFGFCRRQNRHRIFWTTPLISTAASLGIGAVILLQDGTGGRGERLVLVGLLPDRHEEVVLQEQLARTGLLLGSRFGVPESVWLEPIDIDATVGTRGLQLERAGDVFSGEWFVSRAVQGQIVEAVRSSRSRLELDHAKGQNPVLVSTVPDTLTDVYYVDADGGYWHGANAEPGRKLELTRADEQAFDKWWATTTAHHGPRLDEALGKVAPRTIVAAARTSTAALPTLGSIRWHDRDVVYVQPGM